MRVAKERIIFLALCVLEEESDQCIKGPVPKSLGLRLALAYLATVSDKPREWFDEFWHIVTKPRRPGQDIDADGCARSQEANAMMNGICRSVGMERTVELMHAMSRARR